MSDDSTTAGRDREGNAFQHAGVVLICIGVFATGISLHWNSKMSFPEESDLIAAHGILDRIHVESFTSRTSDTKWIVFDVDVGSPEAPATQRWILPDYSPRFDERLSAIEAGQPVTGHVEIQEKMIRASDQAIRVLWSVEQEGEVVLPYDLVLAVEEEIYHHSPSVGFFVAGLGLLFVALSKRFATADGASA